MGELSKQNMVGKLWMNLHSREFQRTRMGSDEIPLVSGSTYTD